MTHFWAKTIQDGEQGISVFHHMLNVGCVAQCLSEISVELLERFELLPPIVGSIAALHDLGKISPGFQRKCEAWLVENELTEIDKNYCWDTTTEPDHGKVSHAAIQTFFSTMHIDRRTAKFISAVIGGHHGRLSPPSDRGYKPSKAISETASTIDWDAERMMHAEMVWDYFVKDGSIVNLTDDSPALWWLGGLTTVSDWIGSDERFFPPERSYRGERPMAVAKRALDVIGFGRHEFIKGLSFHDLFHDLDNPQKRWSPNEMQEKAMSAISGPGVYVVEAPMGMGKTEAALWAAYEILTSGKARGIYFALPTQTTSNRIHLRVNDYLKRISHSAGSSRLIHGNSWLVSDDTGISPAPTDIKSSGTNDARVGRDWFASTKRALLAPFGVGTVDQALLGVVAAKHFFVRHFALAGKVVIIDEVHSYDLYTRTLIVKLITTLERLGCTVIILSATLTGKRREQIVPYKGPAIGDIEAPYPLITGQREGTVLESLPAKPPPSKVIQIGFIDLDEATEEAIELVKKGGAVLWICNTVDSTQAQYQRFKQSVKDELPIGLLHSRFPYWRREALEKKWMERFGKESSNRCGSILVATQVVEQSVDLDADLMISELAPSDMLLQRLGRLWRHPRATRPADEPRLNIIRESHTLEELKEMEAKEIEKSLGSKTHIYAPYVLVRTLEVWSSRTQITIPMQIRQLIEETYQETDSDPASWQKLAEDWFGTDSAKKLIASRNSNLWQVALEDEEGVQTRLNEIPAIQIVLCKSISGDIITFVDLSTRTVNDGNYQLASAQAIHRNLVKVPEYCFKRVLPCQTLSVYLRGLHTIGVVKENGSVAVEGLKDTYRLFYSHELGLVIEKRH